MFHVEVRQFPHVARAFNLGQEELWSRFVASWVHGRPVLCDDHSFSPDRSRLTIYEAPPLRPEEIGLGRGWANVKRSGADVTAQLLDTARSVARRPPEVEVLRRRVLEASAAGSLTVNRVVEMAGNSLEGRAASERLALAERVVGELLRAGQVRLVSADRPLPPESWHGALLDWSAWIEPQLVLQIVPGPGDRA